MQKNNKEINHNLDFLDDMFISINYENTTEFKTIYLKGKMYETEKNIPLQLVIPSHRKIAQEFICKICKNLPLNIVICSNKQEILCMSCREKSEKCPFKCRKCEIITLKEKYLRIFNLIKVKCYYSNFGCSYICEREQYDDHINNCPYRYKYKCSFCDFEGNINYCREHSKFCGAKKLICKYCGKNNIKKYLYKEHTQVCKNEIIFCPYCSQKFTREKLLFNHSEIDCMKIQLNTASELIENQKKIIEEQNNKINQIKDKLNNKK